MFIIDFVSLRDNISELLYSYSSILCRFYVTIEVNLELHNK